MHNFRKYPPLFLVHNAESSKNLKTVAFATLQGVLPVL